MSFRRILPGLVALLLIILIVLLIKTFTYPFRKSPSTAMFSPVSAQQVSASDLSLRRFVGGIRIPTISNEVYEQTDLKPFDDFKVYLAKVYPRIYRVMDTMTINRYGLVFHWKGRNPQLKPLLFLSHYDVVPVTGYDPADNHGQDTTIYHPDDKPLPVIDSVQTKWDYSPFSGAVTGGRIYGRGTLDMKVMLFALMEAADTLIAQGFQPGQDIWFAFGHDEEVSGRQGALKIAGYFKEQGLNFDAVYDEGGIIASPGSALSSVDKPIALVGLGEKGFLTLRIKVRGLGGHSSMPPAKSSLIYAAEIIERLNSHQLPARIIPPIASFLDNIGGEMGFVSRMAIANQWLLRPLLIGSFSKTPASNALIRTTTAVSMAKGSDAPNVLSSTSTVTVNFRILPGDSVAQVIDHVNELCKSYDFTLDTVSAREPSGISPEDTKGFTKLKEVLASVYPDAIVSSYITIGGTDAYKYQLVSDHIYRFMPLYLNAYQQRTIHNENEYIPIGNYGRMIRYFTTFMQKY